MNLDDELDARGYRRPPSTRRGYLTGRVPANKGKKFPPTILSRSDIETMLASLSDSPSDKRLRAYIAFAYRCGLGFTECLELDRSSVNVSVPNAYIDLPDKPNRAGRRVALDPPTVRLITPWIALRTPMPGEAFLCVFQPPTQGRRLSGSDLRRSVVGLARRAGFTDLRVHPSAFNLALIAELLVEQWPLPYIQALMGYKTFEAFERNFVHLGIAKPPDDEVVAITRTRDWAEPKLDAVQREAPPE